MVIDHLSFTVKQDQVSSLDSRQAYSFGKNMNSIMLVNGLGLQAGIAHNQHTLPQELQPD